MDLEKERTEHGMVRRRWRFGVIRRVADSVDVPGAPTTSAREYAMVKAAAQTAAGGAASVLEM